MKRPIALVLAALALCTTALAGAAQFDFVENKTTKIVAAGYGTDSRSSLENALVNAVEEAMGARVTTTVISENLALIEESVTTKSRAYISSYEILSVKTEPDSLIRTVVEAEIDENKLVDKLQTLNIAMVEIDSGEKYADVMTGAQQVENARNYIKSEWPELLKPATKLLKITIKDMHFDEGQVKNDKVPYVVQFTLEPDYAVYDALIKELLKDIDLFKLAADTGTDGFYSPKKENIKLEDVTRVQIDTFTESGTTYPRKGTFTLAVRHGQRYMIRPFEAAAHYKHDIENILAGLGDLSDSKFKITIASKDGKTIHESIFNLFSNNNANITIFLNSGSKQNVFWVDNKNISLTAIGYMAPTETDARHKLTPYPYITTKSGTFAAAQLLIGYQQELELSSIRQISTVTIERVK